MLAVLAVSKGRDVDLGFFVTGFKFQVGLHFAFYLDIICIVIFWGPLKLKYCTLAIQMICLNISTLPSKHFKA